MYHYCYYFTKCKVLCHNEIICRRHLCSELAACFDTSWYRVQRTICTFTDDFHPCPFFVRKRYLSKLPSSTFLSRKLFRSTTMRSKRSPCLFGGLSVNHGGYFNKRWTNSLERNLCMSGTNQSNQLTSMCILLPSWQKRLLIAIGLFYFVNRTVNCGRKLRIDNCEQAKSRDGHNRLP